ncbi:MAG: ACP S-malonyltransferase [Candidatus Poseidoniales archaeon]|nr:ACP S-malonyltransferase [Candidatus Poseidoniales archaeon]
MGRDLYREFTSVKERYAEAEDLLGLSLTGICFDGPLEVLSQTSVTQPAVYVHSVAAAEVLRAEGLDPACAAGHSLGEYSALVAAGALSFRQGLELVAERGRLMQDAGERRPGKMAAVIGLEDAEVEALCAQVGGEDGAVVPANFNAPGQVVVSGEAEAVDEFGSQARQAGAKRVVELQVSGAFHSRLMEPAAREMTPLLRDATIETARIPVVTNVRAEPVTDGEELREQLISQLTQPVRWTASVRALVSTGISLAAEVGPGSVLRGLARRIDRNLRVLPAGTVDDIAETTEIFRELSHG